MELSDTSSSSSDFAPCSASSSNAVPAPKMADPPATAAEDLKLLWPAPVEFAFVPDTFSMAKATEILVSMPDLDNETMFKFLEKLEKPEWRQIFITLNPERRRGWIEYVNSLP